VGVVITRPHLDRTTTALQAGIILGPAVAAVLAYAAGWRGAEAAWALVLGLWIGLLVAVLIALPGELNHRH
jgi:threonine/homoserine/homoserine lactone efflux protein